MIKTVGLFELPPDLDTEDYWQHHVVRHSNEMLAMGGDLLRGYVIQRIRADLVGRRKFWGMVELWFDDEEAREEFNRRTSQARVGDQPGDQLGDGTKHFEDFVVDFSAAEVQEHVVIPAPHVA